MGKPSNMDELLFLQMESPHEIDTWEPAFEAGRCLVHAKVGPFERLYLRPPRFRKRFYHRLHPIPVGTWEINTARPLFTGLCTIEVKLKIRFQATLRYAEKNPEAWEQIDHHIRDQLEVLIHDVVEARLAELESGDWLDTGLNGVEKCVATVINETLALNHIQCRTLCSLQPVFVDLSKVDQNVFIREEIVQAIVKKQTASEQLRFRSDKQLQEERLRQELEQIRFALDSGARKQKEETDSRKRRLEARRKQMAELREIERKLHHETLLHQSRLEQMVLEKQLRDAQKRQGPDTGKRSQVSQGKDGAPSPMESQGNFMSEGDRGDSSVQDSLLKDLESEAAHQLREKERMIASLEERLQMLMSRQKETNQMTIGQAEVSLSWLDRLAQLTGRLLFFIRMRH